MDKFKNRSVKFIEAACTALVYRIAEVSGLCDTVTDSSVSRRLLMDVGLEMMPILGMHIALRGNDLMTVRSGFDSLTMKWIEGRFQTIEIRTVSTTPPEAKTDSDTPAFMEGFPVELD